MYAYGVDNRLYYDDDDDSVLHRRPIVFPVYKRKKTPSFAMKDGRSYW